MKEAAKALKDSKTVREDEMQELRALLTKTKAELKEERDRVIELEDYTRRENLKFHNIPESEEEELHMDTAQIRFHPVHRIGKRKENKHRPIIARFVCREDRDQVFARKKEIKEGGTKSTRFKDAYITADYAKAIQDERRKLIKAMFKAKEQGSEAKVVGFKSKLDLVDIWRSKNPDAKSFTWSQKSPPVFCRLDYWLISNNLSDFVELTEIIPAVRTDHDAISLELGKLENDIERARKLENELLTVR
ncbi:unnamed protein product [Porites lobata]|uniref:Uncharacterized protein n=1 Tax=Porites lobata TaxID=104759 RepID=A0ABN8MQ50_9CNID|nr:unnamed protein product [Porites lobata]